MLALPQEAKSINHKGNKGTRGKAIHFGLFPVPLCPSWFTFLRAADLVHAQIRPIR
jgi:hypothetical protein